MALLSFGSIEHLKHLQIDFMLYCYNLNFSLLYKILTWFNQSVEICLVLHCYNMHYCKSDFLYLLGSKYNVPIQIVFRKSHPVTAPLVFVRPTNNMLIKPNKHVDNSGRVYIPYISEWKAVCVFYKTTFFLAHECLIKKMKKQNIKLIFTIFLSI